MRFPPQAVIGGSSCARGHRPLDPFRRTHKLGRENKDRHLHWVYESLMASGPRKPRKIPGENELSPGIIPWLSPDAKHPGRRLRRRARKRYVVKPDFRVPPGSSGNQDLSSCQAVSAIGVQRTKSFGAGARGPHRPSPRRSLSSFKCLINPRLNCSCLWHYFFPSTMA